MRFVASVAVSIAAFASFCAAQSTSLGFTQVPTSAKAGQAVVLQYTAPTTSDAVTITLRKGQASNLQTIQTLTTSATGGNYTWIVANYFENASDYALEIQQALEVNYSGAITLSGGDTAAISSAEAATASLSSVGAAITSSYAVSNSVASIQSIIASYNSSLHNLTAPVTSAATSSGTSTALSQNTTFVSASLTSTGSSSGSTSSASGSSSSAKTTSASATTSAAAASSSGAAAKVVGAISGSSPLALVFCALAAMFL